MSTPMRLNICYSNIQFECVPVFPYIASVCCKSYQGGEIEGDDRGKGSREWGGRGDGRER